MKRRIGRLATLLLSLLAVDTVFADFRIPVAYAQTSASASQAIVVELDGVIGVAAAAFVARGIEQAHERGAQLVVIRMDTPGGLLSATRDIISSILESPLPVAVYVAPSGARAASAGTYIVYASHIAAMAPGTHIGAATPVSLGGPPGLPGGEREPKPTDEKKDAEREPATAGERKALNDAIAYLRSLAQLRGRNVEFAEAAVRDAATMTATEAQKSGVVEVVAESIEELLKAIDGRTVAAGGSERRLATEGARYEVVSPDWRTSLIAIITDPNVAYLLLLLGFYGILFEFWNPGFVFPGVIGGICLLTALAALSVMPVSYAGLALILLGLALMIAELFAPGVLVLGIGGAVAFVLGSIFLFDPGDVTFEFGVSWPVIGAATLMTIVFMFAVLGFVLKARRRPVVTGAEQMIGSTGEVIDWSGEQGRIRTRGEIWQARLAPGKRPPAPGTKVRLVALDGLTAVIEPQEPSQTVRR